MAVQQTEFERYELCIIIFQLLFNLVSIVFNSHTGTPIDLNFKEERALVFDRRFVILEGIKGVANFTNTVIESNEQLPQQITNLENKVEIDDSNRALLERRLDWTSNQDGFNKQLPRFSIFPKMNKKPPRTFGPHSERIELNTLHSFYDVSDWIASRLSNTFDRRKIISPDCSLAFQRDNCRVLLDLRCDFVSLTRVSPQNLLQNLPNTEHPLAPFCADSEVTRKQSLIDIAPVNWEICFEKSHFYSNEVIESELPAGCDVHTIYLSTNHYAFKPMPDRFLQARAMMFMYGYAVRQARRLYGDSSDFGSDRNYQPLTKPITIQCVFINRQKNNIGFGCFQLNTTAFDSPVKNQVWFDRMYDLDDHRDLILTKLTALQLNGFVN